MPLRLEGGRVAAWEVRHVGVLGPGIVGMPMAALLAQARIREGTEVPAPVTIVQRDSPSSGWKVAAINAGRSPIGGVEPDLDRIVQETTGLGLLEASHDPMDLADADVVLVCIQTDKKGDGPDYGPLMEGLDGLARALRQRPAGNVPLVVFESTLAPSSMATVIRERFAEHGLVEGRDLLLGNSPNRVMPGRLVERVARSDKLAGGLHPDTAGLIRRLYERIVTRGTVHETTSLTAEIVKTLENAYRDVRIAFAAEIVRYCDRHDVDFFAVRDEVNARLASTDAASRDLGAIPTGAILVPGLGVGGHCLPKDGVLLWWRRLEAGADRARSVILQSRGVNDDAPAETLRLADERLGRIAGRVAILGTAYRPDSEDTRNSPTFALARLLLERGCEVVLHDPHVRPDDPNLVRQGMDGRFTRDLDEALDGAESAFVCVAHQAYGDVDQAMARARGLARVMDAAHRFRGRGTPRDGIALAGIGRGTRAPDPAFVAWVQAGFQALERGVAREVSGTVDFLNERYAGDGAGRASYGEVRRLAATCTTGCDLAEALPPAPVDPWNGFLPHLVRIALQA